ncbi:hypothetical protein COY32_01695 [candidate division WWE3 bacterium CG_4_10_14_0_2_um_filter_41_14]|uniref:Uncharacterized protein n=1 Tax=candidate division WWE3 bacterium CG_4_10_14_0_2_um_filter_41_14 TaxID=1975072 RepID=A0A2M7TKR1_UNCKA|nr:MAG: hypothetical protein COY32_01695 [candidate division WWE3 bacterium CG_4_10_14_0_2_um_filter_41_14]
MAPTTVCAKIVAVVLSETLATWNARFAIAEVSEEDAQLILIQEDAALQLCPEPIWGLLCRMGINQEVLVKLLGPEDKLEASKLPTIVLPADMGEDVLFPLVYGENPHWIFSLSCYTLFNQLGRGRKVKTPWAAMIN